MHIFRHFFFTVTLPEHHHISSNSEGDQNPPEMPYIAVFFPSSVSFGVFSHSKVSGQTSPFAVPWGRSLSLPKVLWRVPPTVLYIHPRVRPTLLFICLPLFSGLLGWFLGADPCSLRKGSVEGSPNSSLPLSPSSFSSFLLHFSQMELALGSSTIVKVLVQNDVFVFWGSSQQMAFASQKVLCSVPQSVLYIVGANGSCFRKGSVEGSANCSLHLSPSLLLKIA